MKWTNHKPDYDRILISISNVESSAGRRSKCNILSYPSTAVHHCDTEVHRGHTEISEQFLIWSTKPFSQFKCEKSALKNKFTPKEMGTE